MIVCLVFLRHGSINSSPISSSSTCKCVSGISVFEGRSLCKASNLKNKCKIRMLLVHWNTQVEWMKAFVLISCPDSEHGIIFLDKLVSCICKYMRRMFCERQKTSGCKKYSKISLWLFLTFKIVPLALLFSYHTNLSTTIVSLALLNHLLSFDCKLNG